MIRIFIMRIFLSFVKNVAMENITSAHVVDWAKDFLNRAENE